MLLQISTKDSLQRAAGYCHDAIFDTDRMKYDKDGRIFSLELTREAWEKAEREKRVLFIQRWKVPKVNSVLTLYDVIEAEIHVSDVQDILVDIGFDTQEKLIRFECALGTKIHLKVEDLRGILEDTSKEYFDGTKFTTFISLRRRRMQPQS